MIQTPESLIVEDAVLTYGKGEFATPALRGVSLTARVRYACSGARLRGGFEGLRPSRRASWEWLAQAPV